MVPQVLIKYTLYQMHNALGHNGTAGTYQCLKGMYYWKGQGMNDDVNVK